MAHPEWALKHKVKGTELRYINGKYYLYKISSRWDKKKKRSIKITDAFLGRITEKDGLIPPGQRIQKPKIPIQTKEFGATQVMTDLGRDIIKALEECFPEDWNIIYTLSLMKLLHQSPLKNMEFWFDASYLSTLYPEMNLSKNALTSFMRSIGSQEDALLAFKKKFMEGSEYTIVDVTDIISQSRNMSINHVGYSSKRHFEPQVNFLYFFSVDKKMPGYYRILPGNISGIKALKLAIDEAQLQRCTVVGDKGFSSEEIVKKLEDEKLNYVLPYRRNSSYANYSRLQSREHDKAFDGHFMHQNRPISYYCYAYAGRNCTMFFDEELASRESRDYLVRLHEEKEGYSMEEYRQLRLKFGTLLLITNLVDAVSAQVYELYKSRMEIEGMFDVLKNTLDADTSYMQSNESFQAWALLNHIALLLYYRLLDLLKRADLLQKHSPKDLIERLSEIRKVCINGSWKTTEITSKTAALMKEVGLAIT